jgi:hypothetical protein
MAAFLCPLYFLGLGAGMLVLTMANVVVALCYSMTTGSIDLTCKEKLKMPLPNVV